MARGSLIKTVNNINLIVGERNYLLTSGKTSILFILTSNHIDLSAQDAYSEAASFSLHRAHSPKTLIDTLQNIVLENQSGIVVSLSDYIVAVARRIVN